ncbi:hypothetical protein L1987_34565 [Smallanthus sonchifolius]|uniref:Uncharacterized protein n=1 Tax=Smallanthus sonchifolius TaxID=185202 RepID=A0ACB9HWR5_9ASTR|nr:hypothetical protein L1987_34565 [Smallanthus sonchifolius]
MECQKTIEQTAYPVFYDVEPTQVRKQSGAVGEAFAKHKEEEAAEKWRDALREAAGWELKNTFDGAQNFERGTTSNFERQYKLSVTCQYIGDVHR